MRRICTTIALSLCLAGAAVMPAAASTPADITAPLGITSFDSIVVDDAHGHVFVTGGGSTGLLVRDLAGAAIVTLSGLPGARGMTLSNDGSTLYVALANGDAIAAIDTTTLAETARYDTDVNTCPARVAATATQLWFGYGCDQWDGNIGVFDLSAAPPVATLGRSPVGQFYSAPRIRISPAEPTRMVVAAYGNSPSTIHSLGISGQTLTLLASREVGGNLQDYALSEDGADVVTASGSPYYHPRYRVSDLGSTGVYGTNNAYPTAVAISAGGFVAAGINASHDPDIRVYTSGGTFVREYELGNELADAGLAYTSDGTLLYAVTQDTSSAPAFLHVLHEPNRAATSVTLAAGTAAKVGETHTVSGTLTWPTVVPAGTVLHLSRTGPDGTVVLPDLQTGVNGGFSVTDAHAAQGTYTYEVTFDGDAVRRPASATAAISISRYASTFSLTGPPAATTGAEHVVTGSLDALAPVPNGTAVHVVRITATGSVALPDVLTGDDGAFAIHDTPPTYGTHTYVATWDGDAAHTGASGQVTFEVAGLHPLLTITTNRAAYGYGQVASVAVHLGPTAANRTVRIYQTPYGGQPVMIKEAVVDANGDLFTTRTITQATTFHAWFLGDAQYLPATAERTVTSTARVTQRLSGYYTTSGGYAYYRTTADPTLNVTVSPNRSGSCVTYEAQIYSSGAWRSVLKNTCARLDAYSRTAPKMTATPKVGYAYRVRPTFNGDDSNTKTYGAWSYFRFK